MRVSGASAGLRAHFGGAIVSKLAPPVVQVVLLTVVAHISGPADVGRLALGSAMSFMCGSLGEIGFSTSLAVPARYYGVPLPPLRATRPLRLVGALLGSAAFVALWGGGLGRHEAAFLILTPLPFCLSLAYGYAGALNSQSLLVKEAWITVSESVLIVVTCATLCFFVGPVAAAFTALTVGRAAGAIWRFAVVSRSPSSPSARMHRLLSTQAGFAGTNAAVILQTQVDMVLVGFLAGYALIGIYGPMIRVAYAVLLVAEALSWGLYSRDPTAHRSNILFTRPRLAAAAAGTVLGAALVAVGPPFLHVTIQTPYLQVLPALALLSLVVPLRFVAYSFGVDIVRSGEQRKRIPVLLVSAVILGVGASLGAIAGSLVLMAAARVVTEAAVLAGYALTARRSRAGRPSPLGELV